MVPNKLRIKQHLQKWNFKTIFQEELGWDAPKEHPFTVDYQGHIFTCNLDIRKFAQDVFISCEETRPGGRYS